MFSRLMFFLFLSLAVIVSASMAKAENSKPLVRCALADEKIGYLFTLTVGDSSADGHAITRNEIVCSSVTSKDLMKIYQQFVEKTGIDLINDVAIEFEDKSLSEEYADNLKKAGVKLPEEVISEIEEMGSCNMYPETWFKLFIEIVKTQDPNVEVEILNVPDLDLGGYGLVSP